MEDKMARPEGTPPMDPKTDEADPTQLALARAQGDAYKQALEHMAKNVAHDGGTKEAGQYRIAYAVEEAEGMYEWGADELSWREPDGENLHVEVSVCDRADGRFVPGLRVTATLVTPDGEELGPHEQPLLWHPMIYHYGRNWKVPGEGEYTLRVHVDPPTFMRHDEVNGKRFAKPVDVEFTGVSVQTGTD
jgi:hypothetical protein